MVRWLRRRSAPEPLDHSAPQPPGIPDVVAGAATRVVLISRDRCHLCQDAAALLAQHVSADQITVIDVDAAGTESGALGGLRDRFTDHVPVVYLDRRLLAYWTLSEQRLVHALSGGPWQSPPSI